MFKIINRAGFKKEKKGKEEKELWERISEYQKQTMVNV